MTAESTNLSPAWQSEVRASRSRPATLAVSASAPPGPLASSACGRPGSPGCRTPIRTSRSLGSTPNPSSKLLSSLVISGVPQSIGAADPPGGSAFPTGEGGPPAIKTSCSAAWCGLSQSPIGQPAPLPATSQPTLRGCRRQSRHSCFAWIISSLSFGVMSRKVGQSPGSWPLVQPNTGHCRGFSCAGSNSPSAAGVALLAPAAALAAFLAALLLFFPPEGVVTTALGGALPGGCAAGVSGSSSAATPSALGVAGRTAPLVGGGSSGSVESARWSSHRPWASLLSWLGDRRWPWLPRWSPRRGPRLLL